MFAVICRGYFKLGTKAQYQNAWRIVADYFIKMQSALGSSLHKTDDDLCFAYSRWPSKEMRDRA